MEIILSDVYAPEVIKLFSEQDDVMIRFLGKDSIYYTRYSSDENIEAVWLAYEDNLPTGCIAYRVKAQGTGEIKRLFVTENYRGLGLSKALILTVQEHAKAKGNHILHLSTRITLEPAVSIYRRFGFCEIFRKGLYIEMEKNLCPTKLQ